MGTICRPTESRWTTLSTRQIYKSTQVSLPKPSTWSGGRSRKCPKRRICILRSQSRSRSRVTQTLWCSGRQPTQERPTPILQSRASSMNSLRVSPTTQASARSLKWAYNLRHQSRSTQYSATTSQRRTSVTMIRRTIRKSTFCRVI